MGPERSPAPTTGTGRGQCSVGTDGRSGCTLSLAFRRTCRILPTAFFHCLRMSDVNEKYGARGVPAKKVRPGRSAHVADEKMETLAKLNREASMSTVALKQVDVLLDTASRDRKEVAALAGGRFGVNVPEAVPVVHD